MAESTRSIRPATVRDSARIAEIYNQSILARDSTMDTESVGPAEIAGWLENQLRGEYLCTVSETPDSRVLGWGIVKRYHLRPGYARAAETSLYMDRSLTGQGYGSAVQTHLIEHCRAAGFHHLVAKIWAANDGSIRMHERFGYEVVGVQREIGYVDGQWLDVAILQLVLD
jgi:phosphinothricin acetyltransferase